MTVNGTGFVTGATVTFGAVSGITPTSLSSTVITLDIPDAELDYVASKSVTVTNPGPGGGASNSQTYSVTQPAALRSFLLADLANLQIITGVATWFNEITDDGTKKNVVQVTTGLQPAHNNSNAAYNNKGTVDVVATKFLRLVAWSTALAQPATTIVVGEAAAAAGVYMVDGFSSNRQGMGQLTGSGRLGINAGSAIGQAAGPTTLPKGVYVGVFNGASSAAYRDGNYTTPVITGNAGAQTRGGQTVNGNSGGGGLGTQSFRSIAIFAGVLSTQQLTQFAAWANRDCGA